MPPIEKTVTLLPPTPEVRIQRRAVLTLAYGRVEGEMLLIDELLNAVDMLNKLGAIPDSKEEFKKALDALESMNIIQRTPDGYIAITTSGMLLGCLIETVGVEGGRIKITYPDGNSPAQFEALEYYPAPPKESA